MDKGEFYRSTRETRLHWARLQFDMREPWTISLRLGIELAQCATILAFTRGVEQSETVNEQVNKG